MRTYLYVDDPWVLRLLSSYRGGNVEEVTERWAHERKVGLDAHLGVDAAYLGASGASAQSIATEAKKTRTIHADIEELVGYARQRRHLGDVESDDARIIEGVSIEFNGWVELFPDDQLELAQSPAPDSRDFVTRFVDFLRSFVAARDSDAMADSTKPPANMTALVEVGKTGLQGLLTLEGRFFVSKPTALEREVTVVGQVEKRLRANECPLVVERTKDGCVATHRKPATGGSLLRNAKDGPPQDCQKQDSDIDTDARVQIKPIFIYKGREFPGAPVEGGARR